MLKRIVRRAALAVLLTTACKDVTNASLTAYALTSVAGLSMPAPYAMNPAMDARIMFATMVLREGGRGEWYGRTETAVNGEMYDWGQEFAWKQTGFTIEINLDCPDTASCIAGPHMTGIVQVGRLTFEQSNVMRVPLVFETGAVR